MDNLIKTKKLETRFFLTTAAAQAGTTTGGAITPTNQMGQKPGTAAAQFSKCKYFKDDRWLYLLLK
jgi:hypothetical protein